VELHERRKTVLARLSEAVSAIVFLLEVAIPKMLSGRKKS